MLILLAALSPQSLKLQKKAALFQLSRRVRPPPSQITSHLLQRVVVVDAALKKADQVRRERNSFLAIQGNVPFLDDFPEDTSICLKSSGVIYL
ncbi:hypothetical protein [Ensifer sp. ENS11]|uniref:hypothetical protein n=1 Tax=Ensifer sp. ENS11 TaxID=2769291 RepID=UPI00177F3A15|nr:hypothetical protein [Ensifer sp. ENS11]MBD9491542.1 hypothetical protein [Ensifer sp. ENS11]MDP9635078.1 hypothetical protein [Ensifer adhaerens]